MTVLLVFGAYLLVSSVFLALFIGAASLNDD